MSATRTITISAALTLTLGLVGVRPGMAGAIPGSSATTVRAWGSNSSGQTDVPANLELADPPVLAAGGSWSMALAADGSVVAWGNDDYGQLDVPQGLTDVAALAAGNFHGVALREDGTVAAWGDDRFGQSTVPGGLSGVIAVAGGAGHSLALGQDGTVVAWGWDNYGQATVPSGLSEVAAVDAGPGSHSLAVKQDGTVVAWGNNSDGQTSVPEGLSGVVAIAAGMGHSLALKQDGTVVAWGRNSDGQTDVPAGLAEVVAIAAGSYHSLALKSDGTVVDWGSPIFGGTVPPGLKRVLAIDAGHLHAVAAVAPNQPPVLAGVGNRTTTEGDLLQFQLEATDADDDPLTFSGSNLPDGATVSGDGLFSWTPASGQWGTYPGVRLEVTDGEDADFEEITITVRKPPLGTALVINEFRTRGPNGGNDEFVELYNASGAALNLGGWSLWGSNSSGTTSNRATVPAGTGLLPGGSYLLTNTGYGGSVEGDQSYATGIADDGGVAVKRPDGSIVDQVGMHLGSAYKEGTKLLPLTVNADRSYERTVPGYDTDDNAADFVLREPGTPGRAGKVGVPILAPISDQQVFPGEALDVQMQATDADGDELTFSGSNLPTGASVTPAGLLTWTPTHEQSGTYPGVRLEVTDGTFTAFEEITITVEEVPQLSVEDVVVTEGETAAFTVALSSSTSRTVRAWCATEDDTATAGSDYEADEHQMVIEPGATQHQMQVAVAADGIHEPDEVFRLVVSDPENALVARGEATATIIDADPAPTVGTAKGTVKVKEGNRGTKKVAIPIKLGAVSGWDTRVGFRTVSGTAKPRKDFVAVRGTLTISAGATSGKVVVLVKGDRLKERNETFTVRLFGPAHAVLGRAKTTISILNDDR